MKVRVINIAFVSVLFIFATEYGSVLDAKEWSLSPKKWSFGKTIKLNVQSGTAYSDGVSYFIGTRGNRKMSFYFAPEPSRSEKFTNVLDILASSYGGSICLWAAFEPVMESLESYSFPVLFGSYKDTSGREITLQLSVSSNGILTLTLQSPRQVMNIRVTDYNLPLDFSFSYICLKIKIIGADTFAKGNVFTIEINDRSRQTVTGVNPPKTPIILTTRMPQLGNDRMENSLAWKLTLLRIIDSIDAKCCLTPGCENHECENGATCVPSNIPAPSYACFCPRNYSGRYCEIYFTACSSNPCNNGGTCEEQQGNSYTCNCPPGVFGEFCEELEPSKVIIEPVTMSELHLLSDKDAVYQEEEVKYLLFTPEIGKNSSFSLEVKSKSDDKVITEMDLQEPKYTNDSSVAEDFPNFPHDHVKTSDGFYYLTFPLKFPDPGGYSVEVKGFTNEELMHRAIVNIVVHEILSGSIELFPSKWHVVLNEDTSFLLVTTSQFPVPMETRWETAEINITLEIEFEFVSPTDTRKRHEISSKFNSTFEMPETGFYSYQKVFDFSDIGKYEMTVEILQRGKVINSTSISFTVFDTMKFFLLLPNYTSSFEKDIVRFVMVVSLNMGTQPSFEWTLDDGESFISPLPTLKNCFKCIETVVGPSALNIPLPKEGYYVWMYNQTFSTTGYRELKVTARNTDIPMYTEKTAIEVVEPMSELILLTKKNIVPVKEEAALVLVIQRLGEQPTFQWYFGSEIQQQQTKPIQYKESSNEELLHILNPPDLEKFVPNCYYVIQKHSFHSSGNFQIKVIGSNQKRITREVHLEVTAIYQVRGLQLLASDSLVTQESEVFIVIAAVEMGSEPTFIFKVDDESAINVTNLNYSSTIDPIKDIVGLTEKDTAELSREGFFHTILTQTLDTPGEVALDLTVLNKGIETGKKSLVIHVVKKICEPTLYLTNVGKDDHHVIQFRQIDQLVVGIEADIECDNRIVESRKWALYNVSHHAHHPHLDDNNRVRLHESVKTDQPFFEPPLRELPFSTYVVQLIIVVVQEGRQTDSEVIGFFRILPSAFQAVLVGGEFRAHNYKDTLVIDGSKSVNLNSDEMLKHAHGIHTEILKKFPGFDDPLIKIFNYACIFSSTMMSRFAAILPNGLRRSNIPPKLKYTWFCASNLEHDPADICRGMNNALEYKGSNLEFPPETFSAGTIYTFKLIVSSENSQEDYGMAEQTVTISEAPSLQITCIFNCEWKVNPSEKLVLEAGCRNCRKLNFTWSLVSIHDPDENHGIHPLPTMPPSPTPHSPQPPHGITTKKPHLPHRITTKKPHPPHRITTKKAHPPHPAQGTTTTSPDHETTTRRHAHLSVTNVNDQQKAVESSGYNSDSAAQNYNLRDTNTSETNIWDHFTKHFEFPPTDNLTQATETDNVNIKTLAENSSASPSESVAKPQWEKTSASAPFATAQSTLKSQTSSNNQRTSEWENTFQIQGSINANDSHLKTSTLLGYNTDGTDEYSSSASYTTMTNAFSDYDIPHMSEHDSNNLFLESVTLPVDKYPKKRFSVDTSRYKVGAKMRRNSAYLEGLKQYSISELPQNHGATSHSTECHGCEHRCDNSNNSHAHRCDNSISHVDIASTTESTSLTTDGVPFGTTAASDSYSGKVAKSTNVDVPENSIKSRLSGILQAQKAPDGQETADNDPSEHILTAHWHEYSKYGNTGDLFFLNPGYLQPGERYIITLAAESPFGTVKSLFNFKTNTPPTVGTCSIDPEEGETLRTQFSIDCSGFDDEDEPVSYQFFYDSGYDEGPKVKSDLAGVHKGVLLKKRFEPHSNDMYIPVGNPDQDFEGTITIVVTDAYGMSTSAQSTITVRPPTDLSKEEVSSLVSADKPGSINDLLKVSGDYEGALNLMNCVGKILNSEYIPPMDNMERAELRTSIIEQVQTIPQTGFGLGKETLGTLSIVLEGTTEKDIPPETANLAADIMKKISSSLTESLRSNSISSEQVYETAILAFDGVSSLMKVTAGGEPVPTVLPSSEGPPPTITPEMKVVCDVSKKVISIMEDIADALLTKRTRGEEDVTIDSDQLGMSLRKTDNEPDTNETLGQEGSDMVKLPPLGDANDPERQNFNLKMITSLANPYLCSPSGSIVSTHTISLSINEKTESGLKEVLTSEEDNQMIEIYVKRKGMPQSIPGIITTEELPSITIRNFRSHHTTLTVRNVTVHINVEREDPRFSLLLVFTKSRNLFFDDFTKTPYIIPAEEHKNYLLTLNPENVPLEEGYYVIGLLPYTEEMGELLDRHDLNFSFSPSHVSKWMSYNLTVFVSKCLFHDAETDTWSGEGCEVGPKTDQKFVHCVCSHMTVFSASFLVCPNLIDLSDIPGLFGTAKDNMVVIICMSVMWISYIAGLIWAVKRDREDLAKRGIIVLGDNTADETYGYVVAVYTGIRQNAGTTANVFMQIHGKKGISRTKKLASKNRPVMETAGEDWFYFTTTDSLGELMMIDIWHDDTGENSSWYLSKVRIKDLKTGQFWVFLVNRWLRKEGTDRVRYSIPTVPRKDLLKFAVIFKRRAIGDLRNRHLWFSIIVFPPRSNFTRAQRLTCAFSLLLVSMLINIMFYGIDTKDPDDLYTVEWMQFSLSDFVIGLQSSLLAYPFGFIIMESFTNIKPPDDDEKILVEAAEILEEENVADGDAETLPSSDISGELRESLVSSPSEENSLVKHEIEPNVPKTIVENTLWDNESNFIPIGDRENLDEHSEMRNRNRVCGMGEPSMDDDPEIYIKKCLFDPRDEGFPRPMNTRLKFSGTKIEEPVKVEMDQQVVTEEGCYLPGWFVYISWTVIIFISVACTFFIMLYGLSYGYERSMSWLRSNLTAFFESTVVLDPFQVIVFALIFTYCFEISDRR